MSCGCSLNIMLCSVVCLWVFCKYYALLRTLCAFSVNIISVLCGHVDGFCEHYVNILLIFCRISVNMLLVFCETSVVFGG